MGTVIRQVQAHHWQIGPGDDAGTAVALFVLHTWAVEAAHATPYLAVVSAEKQSGKTRFLEVLTLLVREPWHTASTTEAALFRKIEQATPTLLLDMVRGDPQRAEAEHGPRL